ncbi:MAG TPA: FxsA family protein [Actinomycetota bacterium]|nr:FxsA family protein [Actinomycetota bacterium]
MAGLLALIFIALPIAELAVLIAVGGQIGLGPTIVLLIAVSIAGGFLAKREGIQVWQRFRSAMASGQIPSAEVADGFLILFGAALLLTPGFITDVLGLFLLFPPSRAIFRRGIRRGGGFLLFKRFPLIGGIGAARGASARYRRAKVVRSTPGQVGTSGENGARGPAIPPGERSGEDRP